MENRIQTSIFDTIRVVIYGPDDVWQRWVYVKDGDTRSAGLVDDIVIDPPMFEEPQSGRFALYVHLPDGRRRRINVRPGVEMELASERDVDHWIETFERATLFEKRGSLAAIPLVSLTSGAIAGGALDLLLGTGLAWLFILIGAAIIVAVGLTTVNDSAIRESVTRLMADKYRPMVLAHFQALIPPVEEPETPPAALDDPADPATPDQTTKSDV